MSYNLRLATGDGGRMQFVEPSFQAVLDRLRRLHEQGATFHSVSAARRLDATGTGTTKL